MTAGSWTKTTDIEAANTNYNWSMVPTTHHQKIGGLAIVNEAAMWEWKYKAKATASDENLIRRIPSKDSRYVSNSNNLPIRTAEFIYWVSLSSIEKNLCCKGSIFV
jgi:hypothetical protein